MRKVGLIVLAVMVGTVGWLGSRIAARVHFYNPLPPIDLPANAPYRPASESEIFQVRGLVRLSLAPEIGTPGITWTVECRTKEKELTGVRMYATLDERLSPPVDDFSLRIASPKPLHYLPGKMWGEDLTVVGPLHGWRQAAPTEQAAFIALLRQLPIRMHITWDGGEEWLLIPPEAIAFENAL